MERETKELAAVLGELAALLERDGETHWRAWVLSARARLERGDPSGAEHLLRAYGGMGSFNDLVLGTELHDGRVSWKPGGEQMNARLDVLRTRAWELARHLTRG